MRCDLHIADQRPTAGIRADHLYLAGCITEVLCAKRGQQSSELAIEVLEDGPGCSRLAKRIAGRKQNAPGIGGAPADPAAAESVVFCSEARYAQSAGQQCQAGEAQA